jgi:hypothetical protein
MGTNEAVVARRIRRIKHSRPGASRHQPCSIKLDFPPQLQGMRRNADRTRWQLGAAHREAAYFADTPKPGAGENPVGMKLDFL